MLGALWLFAAGSHHAAWAANEPISSPASSGGVIQPATAQQAYNETLAWATGINSQSYLNDLYLRLERESYRYQIIPEFSMAVLAAEARYGGLSWARYDSWTMYELTTGSSLHGKYPKVLDDINTALSELRLIMKSSETVEQVFETYWCGPRGEFNIGSLAMFSEGVSKLWNALEPYWKERKANEDRQKYKQNYWDQGDSDLWRGLPNVDIGGYRSRLKSMPHSAAELKLFPEHERSYVRTARSFNKNLSEAEALIIARAILTYCDQTKGVVDPRFIMAMVAAESSFKPRAVSKKGAMGLGQLMPATARSHGISDPFDPIQNLWACVKYIEREMYRWSNQHDRLERVIASYNAGPGAVQRYNGVPPYKETLSFIKRVKSIYLRLAPELKGKI
ncbi:lytic transglycosylase domain-containing protein [bacterium]|nr:lytic transglycosylase domain-containing protein [bacterium]